MSYIKQDTGRQQIVELVSFKVSDEEYGMDILQVQEIIRMIHLSTVPSAPAYVKGVVELRDKVIPVIDMRLKLELPPTPYDGDTRIIVVNDEELTVGLIVDAVCEVIRLDKSEIEKPPSLVEREDSQYIIGVSKQNNGLLILLDIKALLSISEFLDFINSNNALGK